MRRLGPKVRSGEARFGLELDWESCGGVRCSGDRCGEAHAAGMRDRRGSRAAVC